jgi:hypothetical protein
MAFILTKDHSTSNRLKRGYALNQSIGNIMRQIRVRFLLFFSTSVNFPATSPLLWRAALHRSGLTHDALDHHRRDARKHGLGHRRCQDVGDRA